VAKTFFKASQTAAREVMEAKGGRSVAKVSTKAVARQTGGQAPPVPEKTGSKEGAVPVKGGKDVLLKDVPQDVLDWLEAERPRRGFRSRQVLLMAILTEARAAK
jgi:hypothetical protein